MMRDHYAAGANLFTHRRVIEQVKGFDDRLLNLGDKEFGQRVHAAGWDVVFCPEAVVFHSARTTLGQLLGQAKRQTNWREKLAFVWMMHRLKWAIAWERIGCCRN